MKGFDRADQQCMALAGLFQSADQVDQLARTGHWDDAAVRASLASLLVTDPQDTLDVYGDLSQLRRGLAVAGRLLRDPSGQGVEVMRSVWKLLTLDRRLAAHPEMLADLAEGVEKARAAGWQPSEDDAVEHFARLYRETISRLRPRILVRGSPEILARPLQAARVRALLLAGIRSARLYHQLGGSRLHWLWGRGRCMARLSHLSDQAEAAPKDDD